MKVKVTRSGMTSCPSCLSYFVVGDLQTAHCPFCDTSLKDALREQNGGRGAMELIRSSRAGLVAAALAGSLTLAACSGDDDNNKDGDNATANSSTADMGSDADATMQQEDVFEDPNIADYALAPAKAADEDDNANG